MVAQAANTITGIVGSVNPKGLKIVGDDAWHNFSKYANNLTIPSKGDAVSVTLDNQGFIRSIEVNGPTTSPSTPPQDREQAIRRMWAMNCSVSLLASGNRPVEAKQAARLAEQLLTWLEG